MYTGSIQEKLKSLFLLNKKRLKKLLFVVYAGYALSASKTDKSIKINSVISKPHQYLCKGNFTSIDARKTMK
jgi:hypothetical protein